MKKINIIGAVLLAFTCSGALQAHSGKTTAVMLELANYHEALLANAGNPVDTGRLVGLLKAGGDSAKATKVFEAAVPLALELGKAGDARQRLDAYARLVDKLVAIHGLHDDSGTHVFYCPMAKKTWVARGETVRNPYFANMRSCGSKRQHSHG